LTLAWRLQELLADKGPLTVTWAGETTALLDLLGRQLVILAVAPGTPSLDPIIAPLADTPGSPLRLVVLIEMGADCFQATRWFIESWSVPVPAWHDVFPDPALRANEVLRLVCVQRAREARLSREACDAIGAYSWDGGEAELLARVERGLTFADNGEIDAEALGMAIGQRPPGILPLQAATETMTMAYVAAALAHCGGNRSETARALKCDVRSIFRYVERLQSEDVEAFWKRWSMLRSLVASLEGGKLIT
jgi:hypothetical protein